MNNEMLECFKETFEQWNEETEDDELFQIAEEIGKSISNGNPHHCTEEELKERCKSAYEENLKRLHSTRIYKDCDAFVFGDSAFYRGGLDRLTPFDKELFEWKFDSDTSEIAGEPVYYLTLGELAEQLKKMEYQGIMTLFVNYPTHGFVYQLGNYAEHQYDWYELGQLKGFA